MYIDLCPNDADFPNTLVLSASVIKNLQKVFHWLIEPGGTGIRNKIFMQDLHSSAIIIQGDP